MLTREQYYQEMDWDLWEQAKNRIINDLDLKEYVSAVFSIFPLRSNFLYTITVADKGDLMAWVKGKRQLKLLSYKKYLNAAR